MAPESKLDRVASFRDIQALEKLLTQHFEAHDREHELMDRANVIAREEMNRRLDEMNNLRRQIEQVEAKFFTRTEWEKAHAALVSVVQQNERSATLAFTEYGKTVDGRFRVTERWVWMASGAVALLALLMHWLKP
jgi:hypothetical protein